MAKRKASTSPRGGRGFTPGLERFERRDLLAVTVYTGSDFGTDSLRAAIDMVNAGQVPDDTIDFFIETSGGPAVISLFSDLPEITHHVIIRGETQPGSSPNNQVNTDNAVIGVSLLGYGGSIRPTNGLVFGPGSEGSSVRGLAINGFVGDGILIKTNNVTVAGNFIGVGVDGQINTNSNGSNGVHILNGTGNTIGGANLADRNMISGNTQDGVLIEAGNANVVIGNFIGVDVSGGFQRFPDGPLDPGNGANGVHVIGGVGNTIGSAPFNSRNVISGNRSDGIYLQGGSDHVVSNNLIGTQSDGLLAVGNASVGVFAEDSTGASIGLPGTNGGNVISGNGSAGLLLLSRQGATTGDLVRSNTIGLGVDGMTPLPNQWGILAQGKGDTIGAGNLVSGNGQGGIAVGFVSTDSTILGSTIGLNINGVPAPNAGVGIAVYGSAVIGSANPSERNVISGNQASGIEVDGTATILGNLIGLNPQGTAAAPNGAVGIFLNGAHDTVIRGAHVAGNADQGITIANGPEDPAAGNSVLGSVIGLALDGTTAVPNGRNGILVLAAVGSTIGGTSAGDGNTIGGNSENGISVIGGADASILGNRIYSNGSDGIYLNAEQSSDARSTISGNVIGLNASGNPAGNAGAGIQGEFAANVSISGNTISANTIDGILLRFSGFSGSSSILGNQVGTDLAGTAARGNGRDGIRIEYSDNVAVGGSGAGQGNVVSGNTSAGVHILSSSIGGVTVLGNRIGTDRAGAQAIPNDVGILYEQTQYVPGQSSGLVIGGPASGEGNLISGNTRYGIWEQLARSSSIVGNTIGTNLAGTSYLSNGIDGIRIDNGLGNTVGPNNWISGNVQSGVHFNNLEFGGSNTVIANSFGLTPAGASLPANGSTGILLEHSNNNVIGKPGLGNVVSNNAGSGNLTSVGIELAASTGNLIQSNLVGTDPTGTSDRGNNIGIYLHDASTGNTIGGTAANTANTASGNDDANIQIEGGSTGNLVTGNVIGPASNGTSPLTDQHINDPNLFPNDPARFTDQRSRIGVLISGAGGNTVTTNTIANLRIGVQFNGAQGSGNVLTLNAIGINAALGNEYGVFVNDAPNNRIGLPGQGNTISGSQQVGVEIFGPLSTGNSVQGNTITGNLNGVFLQGASGNLIGGSTATQGNDIVANKANGVYFYLRTTTNNQVASNRIRNHPGAGVVLVNAGTTNKVQMTGPTANIFSGNAKGNIRTVNSAAPIPNGGSVTALVNKTPAAKPKAKAAKRRP